VNDSVSHSRVRVLDERTDELNDFGKLRLHDLGGSYEGKREAKRKSVSTRRACRTFVRSSPSATEAMVL